MLDAGGRGTRASGWPDAVRHVVLATLLCSTASCAAVHISDGGGNTRVERHFGLLNINLDPSTQTVVADAQSFGLMSDSFGVSFGYTKSRIAAVSADCRVVIWGLDPQRTQDLQEGLKHLSGICVIANREE